MNPDRTRRILALEEVLRMLVPACRHDVLTWVLEQLAELAYEETIEQRDAAKRDGRCEGNADAWTKAQQIWTAAEHSRDRQLAKIHGRVQ